MDDVKRMFEQLGKAAEGLRKEELKKSRTPPQPQPEKKD